MDLYTTNIQIMIIYFRNLKYGDVYQNEKLKQENLVLFVKCIHSVKIWINITVELQWLEHLLDYEN